MHKHYILNKQKYLEKADRHRKKTFEKNRKIVTDYLRQHPCVDCGNDDVEVLEFDHSDPKLKITEVSKLLLGSLERLLNEINKCEIRCANCHIKRTRRQFNQWIDTAM